MQTRETSGIYWSELTISDFRCWILLCRLSKWSCDAVETRAGPWSVAASLQRAWRDALRCCQAMKNWRDKAKWWVGTDELTFNMLAISNSHYIHLHQLTMERYISPNCNSDKRSIRARFAQVQKWFYGWGKSKYLLWPLSLCLFLVVIKEWISVVTNWTGRFNQQVRSSSVRSFILINDWYILIWFIMWLIFCVYLYHNIKYTI